MQKQSIFFNPTNVYELKNVICSLKDKAGGTDGIHTIVLKKMCDYICIPLTHIFNLCLNEGVFPEHFKYAEIIPIYKSSSKSQTTNYRPIALISNIAKILEKIIHKRLSDYLEKYNLISTKQFGFLKNLGTADALASTVDFLYDKLGKSKPTAAVFLDLAKAFDSVDHNILIDKLYFYGIRGTASNLIKSYLNNRNQCVKVNGVKSSYKTIGQGVPQGTILGPLFFIIYINDMLMLIKDIIAYADDTVVMCSENSWSEVERQLNSYLNVIYNWLYSNKLVLNLEKTHFIAFGNHNDTIPSNLNILINNYKLDRAWKIKYLGVYLDCNLRWNEHISWVTNKLKYLVYVFARFKKSMCKVVLLKLYYGLFSSIANYGIISWGSARKTIFKKLSNLQTRIIKIIFTNVDNTNKPLTIKQNYYVEAVLRDYKLLSKLFSKSRKKTRNESLPLPKHRIGVAEKNYSYTAIKVFNLLPIHLRTLKSNYSTIRKLIVNQVRYMD